MTGWHWLLLGLGVTLVVYAALLVGMVLVGRRRDARAVASFLPDCLFLLRGLLRDPRVPTRRKLLVAALLAYLATPFDLVPDFIPIAGQLDDAIVVALVLRAILRSAGERLLRENWPGPERSLTIIQRLTFPASKRDANT